MESQITETQVVETEEEFIFTAKASSVPEIISNYIDFKKRLLFEVEKFKIQVTEDNISKAKNMMASLNKIKKAIKTKEKEVKDFFNKPIEDIGIKIKELEKICDDNRELISSQVDKFENETRKECEKLIIKMIADLRSDYKIRSEFFKSEHQDLIKLTALTAKGGLKKETKEAIDYRVKKEQMNQMLYDGRIDESFKECTNAGIEPFTTASISHLLLLEQDIFKSKLKLMIDAELERNAKIKEKAQKEADEKAKKEFQDNFNAKQKQIREEQEAEAKKKLESEGIYNASIVSYDDKNVRVIEEIKITSEEKNKIEKNISSVSVGYRVEEVEKDKEGNQVIKKAFQIGEEKLSENNQWKPWESLMSEKLGLKQDSEISTAIKLRPSSMPRIMACPASRINPEVLVNEHFDAVEEGNALDEFANIYFVEDNKARKSNVLFDAIPLIEEIQKKHNVDIGYLCWNLIKLTEKYRPYFQEVMTQVPLSVKTKKVEIEGTSDLYAQINESKGCILDVKAGFVAKDYSAQVKTYAMSILSKFKTLEQVTVLVVYCKLNKVEAFHFRREDAKIFYNEILETIKSEKKQVGEHCTYCPLRYECPEKQAVLSGTIKSLVSTNDINFVAVHEKVQLIRKALSIYDNLFKQEVQSKGELRIGTTTYYIESKIKDEIDLNKCFSQLASSIKDLPEALTLSETKLKELVQKRVPLNATKEDKQNEWRAFLNNAKIAGWTTETESLRLSQK